MVLTNQYSTSAVYLYRSVSPQHLLLVTNHSNFQIAILIARVAVVWKMTMDKYISIIVLLGTMYTAFVLYFLASFLLLVRPLQCEYKWRISQIF